MTVAAWVLSQLGPKLMRVDLAEECRKLEEEMQGGEPLPLPMRREIRAARLCGGSGVAAGSGVASRALERAATGRAAFSWNASAAAAGSSTGDQRSDASRPATSLRCPGGARRWSRCSSRPGSGLREVDDKELLDLPGELVDVVVTNAAIDGRTLAELGAEERRAACSSGASRARGEPLGVLPGRRVQRGDVLTIVGSAANVARAVELIGVADRATDVTDMFVVATAIVAGALIGLPALHFGNVEIGLSLPVGVLLGGLVCGWLRSVRPRWFGRIPGPTLWVFESIGLTGFVAVVGLERRSRFRAKACRPAA